MGGHERGFFSSGLINGRCPQALSLWVVPGARPCNWVSDFEGDRRIVGAAVSSF